MFRNLPFPELIDLIYNFEIRRSEKYMHSLSALNYIKLHKRQFSKCCVCNYN